MKILTAAQIKEADRFTILNEPITSIELMERAARACTDKITELLSDKIDFINIVCGKGNNGGDGLAIARQLAQIIKHDSKQRFITVFIVEHKEPGSEDFEKNFNRLQKETDIPVVSVKHRSDLTASLEGNANNAILIDAIFGCGINKRIEGIAEETIDEINKSGIPVISIDMPSGLFPDKKTIGENKAVVHASLTLTFQQPKLAFMMPENGNYCGEFIVLDIGLDRNFISTLSTEFFFIDKTEISPLLTPRKKFSHKGSFGHALLAAGSFGKMGAAVMAARACLRSGTGLLTVHVPSCGINVMQTALPEAMVSADEEEKYISQIPFPDKINAAGIGPGIDTDEQTGNVLKLLIQNFAGPIVLDADALNLLADNRTWLGFLKPLTILTPHPKEFDRLAGSHTSDFDRWESAKDFAVKYNVIVILKGAHTAIITPTKKTYFNSTGNPGMAKGGSGDVLTGILTALLARGYNPLAASMIGVFLHGLAADHALKNNHEESMTASDIIENIAAAFIELEKK